MIYFSVSDVLERSWELTKRYGIVLVIVYFVLYLIQYFVGNLFTPAIDVDALQSALENQDFNAIMKLYYSNPTGMIVSTILSAVIMLALSIAFFSWLKAQPMRLQLTIGNSISTYM